MRHRVCTGGGATTTGPDATHPPTIFQNLGGGGGQLGGGPSGVRGGGVPPGGQGGVWPGGYGGVQPGVRGGGGVRVRVRVTELVEPVLVL